MSNIRAMDMMIIDDVFEMGAGMYSIFLTVLSRSSLPRSFRSTSMILNTQGMEALKANVYGDSCRPSTNPR
jgi:hypothetical protein